MHIPHFQSVIQWLTAVYFLSFTAIEFTFYCSFHAILPKWKLKNIYTSIPISDGLERIDTVQDAWKSCQGLAVCSSIHWTIAWTYSILWFVLLNHLGFLVWSDTPWASNSPIFGDPNLFKVNKICISRTGG